MKLSVLTQLSAFVAAASAQWVDIWNASPQVGDSPSGSFRNTTIRQTLHLTLATTHLRVKLSNEFGSSPLEITTSSAALTSPNQAGSANIDTSTSHSLSFSGKASVTIAAGGTALSDAFNLTTTVGQELGVSLYLANGQSGANITTHDKSHTSTLFAPGDQTSKAALSGSSSAPHWYFVTEVQGREAAASALICVGDSITDGTGSDMNANNRWADDLFVRMQANSATKNIAVLNAGIGGNHLVSTPGTGPSALDRIKGIIAQPGVRYVAILEGVNDIGHSVLTQAGQDDVYNQMVGALQEIIKEVKEAGLAIFGGTLTPSFVDPPYSGTTSNYANPMRAATRNRLNEWIVKEAGFDYVVDYAAAVANKTHPDQYQDRYAFENYIHPSVAGQKAMANAWDLSVFAKFGQ